MPTEHIPAELRARVRGFRQRIDAADLTWVAGQTAMDIELKQRIRRRKLSFRPEDGIDMARKWRTATLTQFGQRPMIEWTGTRKVFKMEEARLMGSVVRFFSWDEGAFENGVDLVKITTIVDPRQDEPFVQTFTPIIMWSEHALLRYFQRAFHACDGLLVDACWEMLSIACFNLLKKGAERVPVQNGGGSWCGRGCRWFEHEPATPEEEETIPNGRCYSVRTFYTAD